MTSIPINEMPWPRNKVLQSLIASSEAACVFVVAPDDGKPVHVGLSKIPRKRMWQLKSEQHRPTHIHGMAWAMDIQAERLAKAARTKLAARALGGNWFDVTPQAAINVIVGQTSDLKIDTASHGKFLAAIDRQHTNDEAEFQTYWPDLDLNPENSETLIQCMMDKRESMDEDETAARLVAAMTHQIKSQAAKATA